MLDGWVFETALLIVSLVLLFHGCILLFAPDRYIPISTWGPSSLRLVRKSPLQIGKRFVGLCLSVAIIGLFTLPAVSWMLHPKPGDISYGESPLPRTMARWDLLGVAIVAIGCGYLLFMRPKKSVESLFAADINKLQDKTTLRLWIFYVRMSAYFFMVWSLLPLANFIRSLR